MLQVFLTFHQRHFNSCASKLRRDRKNWQNLCILQVHNNIVLLNVACGWAVMPKLPPPPSKKCLLINFGLIMTSCRVGGGVKGQVCNMAEEDAVIDNFVVVTGASKERATFFLHSAGWNLQVYYNMKSPDFEACETRLLTLMAPS